MENNKLYLSDLKTGQTAFIKKVTGRGAFKRRLYEMGFTRTAQVTVIKNAPLKDPIEYEILGYNISLRRSEAEKIEVETPQTQDTEYHSCDLKDSFQGFKSQTEINIALVGNPNAGKTSLFNKLTKANEHVGNYSGVTVGSKTHSIQYKNYKINFVDLPGTYSISSFSPEEVYVRSQLIEASPDIVLNVIDSGNLYRNLFLTTQVLDMDLPIIVALNMYDDLEKKGNQLNYTFLGKMLGIPMVPTVASKNKGINSLLDKIVQVFEGKEPDIRHIHINYGKDIEKAIQNIQQVLKTGNEWLTDAISSRFIAIKLLENDKEIQHTIADCKNLEDIQNTTQKEIQQLEARYQNDTHALISDAKYAFIRGALKETFVENQEKAVSINQKIDRYITHKYLGFPIFIAILWLMFQSTFWLGSYPMDWIDALVSSINEMVGTYMPDGMLKDLITDGIISGVGGVIIFLPNILILFFFISLMEDTGYMARAAFIMDKLMHKIGLHGKSFIPLIMGFGCNVPAILATRTIENRSERFLTILINPFMSCSARLPVYVLITAVAFPNQAGNVIFLIYIIGIVLAALMALLFKKALFSKSETPFVMELPPYRLPIVKVTLKNMWSKAYEYLRKMGGVILVASIIVWALGYFPLNEEHQQVYEQQQAQIEQDFQAQNITEAQRDSVLSELQLNYQNERLSESYIGRMGKSIEPAITPLGFDWRIGISILSGVPAKEIVVSTMGVLFKTDTEESEDNLTQKLKQQVHQSGIDKGKPLFDSITAFTFLLFVLIYFPCIATMSAVQKEMGSWKWALFLFVYTTVLAYGVSFIFYQVAHLF